MKTLRILFLAPRLPWPLDTGGKIRTYHLLAALARQHRVRLLTVQEGRVEPEGVEAVRQLGAACELFPTGGRWQRMRQAALGLTGPVPFTVRKYACAALQQRVEQLSHAGDADLVHCDHIHMAPYGPRAGLPFVIDEHNVETIIWERFALDRAEPLHRRLVFAQQALLLRRLEGRLAARASQVLLCSEQDREALAGLLRGRQVHTKIVPNGVDVEQFSSPGPAELSGHVFFSGSMDWAPNENAVLTFLDEIWPAMRGRLPGLQFVVVGRNPGPRLEARHGADGVTITGTVPDVRPYMRGALALLVPMRVGGGTRLKILEAFAAGVPVISTNLGIEGIEAQPDRHYLRAENAEQFATQAARLQDRRGLGRALCEAASERVRGRYSWDAIGADLAQEYARRF